MNAVPVMIAAAAMFAMIRLGLRRLGNRPSSAMGTVRARRRGRNVLGDTGLVAGREIRERLRGRVFRVVTVILFAAVAAAVVIPTIHSGTTHVQRIGVVAGSPSLDAELQRVAAGVEIPAQLMEQSDL
ncbi:MAG: hypothetical protein JO265_07815, partial [Acidimicrobiia bacterium]|nr:hypothetical protein [Acidimicrobiia bacterium]